MLNNAPKPLLHIADVSGSALFNADCMDILPLIPDKSVQLIFADPPYFKIKGDFDFIWKSFGEYLADVEKWAMECKRILAYNGTVLWYGHSKNIAYSQIILDKYFTLESSIAIELTAGHIRRSNKESFRRFAPCSERVLMYSTGKNNKELCGDLISKIKETATEKEFIDCFMKLVFFFAIITEIISFRFSKLKIISLFCVNFHLKTEIVISVKHSMFV